MQLVRRTIPLALGLAGLFGSLLPGVALGQSTEGDRFTCQATLIRIEDNAIIGTQALGEANTENGGDPCQTDDASLIGEIALGPVTADVLFSRTSDETEDGRAQGHAKSGVAEVTIDFTEFDGPELQVDVLTAEAQAGPCPSTDLSGESNVVALSVDGDEVLDVPATFTGDEHFELPIPGIGTLHLNEEDNPDPNTIRRRALFFEDETGVIGNIIIAEAIADVHGNPCRPEPPDRLPGWMTGGGFVAEPDSKQDRNDEGMVDPGVVEHHAFSIDCFFPTGDDPGRKDHLVVSWRDDDGQERGHFRMAEVLDARCTHEDDQGDANPPRSSFNQMEGEGIGFCRSGNMTVPAMVEFRFTDEGEPGRMDEAEIHVSSPAPQAPVLCDLDSEGELDGGNHQAHQLPAQRLENGGGGGNAQGNRF